VLQAMGLGRIAALHGSLPRRLPDDAVVDKQMATG
jgi:hypothetical protein